MSAGLEKLSLTADVKKKILSTIGEYLVNETKKNITVKHILDTGLLRNSIQYEIDGDTLYVGTNLEYGIYQELGTGLFAVNGDGRTQVPWSYQDGEGVWHSTCGVHPRPYLQPALDDNKNEIQNIVANVIKKELGGKP